MVDYYKIITDIGNKKSIGEVKMVRDEQGKYFFSGEDNLRFISPLLEKDLSKKIENSKAVGILLAKIK